MEPTDPKTLYPVMDSTPEVVTKGKSMLPITQENQITALLMTYHNTLLQEVEKRHRASQQDSHAYQSDQGGANNV